MALQVEDVEVGDILVNIKNQSEVKVTVKARDIVELEFTKNFTSPRGNFFPAGHSWFPSKIHMFVKKEKSSSFAELKPEHNAYPELSGQDFFRQIMGGFVRNS